MHWNVKFLQQCNGITPNQESCLVMLLVVVLLVNRYRNAALLQRQGQRQATYPATNDYDLVHNPSPSKTKWRPLSGKA
jgi:hypothetical protein